MFITHFQDKSNTITSLRCYELPKNINIKSNTSKNIIIVPKKQRKTHDVLSKCWVTHYQYNIKETIDTRHWKHNRYKTNEYIYIYKSQQTTPTISKTLKHKTNEVKCQFHTSKRHKTFKNQTLKFQTKFSALIMWNHRKVSQNPSP